MIGIKEIVTARLEIEFEVLAGELGILEQNALDQNVEKLIAMWGDQIKQARLMVLLHELKDMSNADKSNRRNRKDLG